MPTHHSDDAKIATDAASSYLLADPVAHNLVLTLLQQRIAHPEPGHYWWVTEADRTVGFAMQSPRDFHAGVVPTTPTVTDQLAERMHEDAPHLPGVSGEAATAARLAGRWTELAGAAARPVEAQRLYVLDTVTAPVPSGRRIRPAVDGDLDLVVQWAEGFVADTGLVHPGDLRSTVAAMVTTGRVFLLESDGRPVSMARASEPVARVCRIGWVYTPPELRARGLATELVATLSARELAAGSERCTLYTQLANPTSNGIYRAIGYRAVAEIMTYAFGPPDTRS